MNSSHNILSYTPVVGFCISEKLGLYIVNRSIVGFKYEWVNGDDVIILYTSNQNFIIYKHDNDLDFQLIAKKIIMRIMDSLRYDNTININLDNIINEVIKNEKETINSNIKSE